jgi:leader peptidase (prepilin peptidase) / N-methyltransferase
VTAAAAWARARPFGSLFAVALAAVVLARYGVGAAGLIAAFSTAVLVLLALIDIDSRRLPNRIVLPAAILVLSARLVSAPEHRAAWLGASLGAAGFLLVFALAFPGGLGMGDVKLALLLGAMLGDAVVPAFLLGTLAGAAAAAVLLFRDGRQALGRTIPFGPYLTFGAVATALLLAP